MHKAKLTVKKRFKDGHGNWVICLDQNGKDWIVKQDVFSSFKILGLPPIASDVEQEAHKLLNGRHYPDIPLKERYLIIRNLLEKTLQGPIQLLFPNI